MDFRKFGLKKILLLILVAILVSEVAITFVTNYVTLDKLRLSNLELVNIIDSSCQDCASTSAISTAIKNQKVKVVSEKTLEMNSQEAQQLISKYKITKVPVLLVLGEITRDEKVDSLLVQLGGIKSQGAVYINSDPPYVDIATNQVKGRVSVTNIVDSSCSLCFSFKNFADSLKTNGVKIVEEKTLEYNSSAAKDLMSTFSIQKVPAMILSKDAAEYAILQSTFSQLGTTEKSGYYALDAPLPPYRNISIDKVDGLITLINLDDKTCTTCYNVSVHKQILLQYGVQPANSTSVDVSSDAGKSLVSKYNITKVPTILLSPDASLYTSLASIWSLVGEISSDGWFVFNSVETMGIYKDLSTGQVVSKS